MLFDNTGFGSDKDGFVLTNKSIQYHNMWTKPGKIYYSDIESIKIKGSDLIINDTNIYINLISSKYRSQFCTYVETLLSMLKEVILILKSR